MGPGPSTSKPAASTSSNPGSQPLSPHLKPKYRRANDEDDHVTGVGGAAEQEVICNDYQDETTKKASVRGRKRKVQTSTDDIFNQKMAFALKSPRKVQTTHELVQEMALKTNSPGTNNNSRNEWF